MIEYVKKADVLEIMNAPLPRDIAWDYIYDLKGVWLDEDEIDTSQTENADRPQGEWIVSSKDSICPVCGKDEAEFICGTEDWYGYGLSNYCPNCGARMKGADDE